MSLKSSYTPYFNSIMVYNEPTAEQLWRSKLQALDKAKNITLYDVFQRGDPNYGTAIPNYLIDDLEENPDNARRG